MKLNKFPLVQALESKTPRSNLRAWGFTLLVFLSCKLETASASFCKAALKEMGQTTESEGHVSNQNHQLDMRLLLNTIVDTKDFVADIKQEQSRALDITRATNLIHQRVDFLINKMGPQKTFLKKINYFTTSEAAEFAKYSSQLKTLKKSIEHLQLAVPISIEKIVNRMVSYHTNISDALVTQMEETLIDLVRNDPTSSKIVELEALIENQALNSQNDRILERLKDLIDGLKVVDESVNKSLVPEVLPIINETISTVSEWLSAYNDPMFKELFKTYPADLVFEAYQKTRTGTLSHSHTIITNYIEAIGSSRN